MTYLAVNKKEGQEVAFSVAPYRKEDHWSVDDYNGCEMHLPAGTIESVLKRALSWDDDPVLAPKEFNMW